MENVQVARTPFLGHVPDLSNDEYHDALGTSKTMLDEIAAASPLHFWAKRLDPNRVREQRDVWDVGNAIHTAILEPDLLLDRVAGAPECDRRTKEGKAIAAAFELENAGKVQLKHDTFQMVLAVRDAAYRHPVASGLLSRGRAEQSYFAPDPETGALLKCRCDYIYDDASMIIDVKSAVDASPTGFGRAAANFRYDLQAAWYPDVVELATGARPAHFVWIAMEKDFPFAIGVYVATEDQVKRARAVCRRDLLNILEHERTQLWPDYGETPQELQLPAWAKR
jgi:exodeoxyribonuclease VIII